MKKALALSAFALVMTLPLVGSAGTVNSSFVTSSSGTSLVSVGDTITFEVSVITEVGNLYDGMQFSLSGDEANGLTATSPLFDEADHQVEAWSWNYITGGRVKFDTSGSLLPADNSGFTTLPIPVSIGYGWFGQGIKTGQGVTSVVGTVTIRVDASGVTPYQGGGIVLPGVDGFAFNNVGEAMTVNAATFSVVPEPGTAVLMVLGLTGLTVMGRNSRK